jgi:hypothetical protein
MSLGQPAPPSPGAINANATQADASQAALNTGIATQNQAGSNYNQTDPYGSLSYSQTGTGPNGTPLYTSSVNLSQPQQNLLNLLQGSQTTAGGQAGNLLTGANYGSTAPSTAIGDLTSGLTNQNTQEYLQAEQPFFTTQTDQLNTQLANEGLGPTDPAYQVAMRQLQTNQGLTTAGATAAFEPTAFNQATTEFTLPEALATSLGTYGAPANPTSQFQGGSALNIQTPNEAANLSAETTAAQNQYTAQQNQYNALVSGLMGVGNAGLGMLALA